MNTAFPKLKEDAQLRDFDKTKQPMWLLEENTGQYQTFSATYPGLELDDDDRHWSPASQWYAPVDILLQYLRNGWELDREVEIRVHRCTSHRHVEIYRFTLNHAEKKSLRMPVVANPVVRKIVHQYRVNTLYVFTEAPASNTDSSFCQATEIAGDKHHDRKR